MAAVARLAAPLVGRMRVGRPCAQVAHGVLASMTRSSSSVAMCRPRSKPVPKRSTVCRGRPRASGGAYSG